MKTQILAAIKNGNSGNLFADFVSEAQIAAFLDQQNAKFIRGIVARCGINIL
jgi:hypothetical protein